MGNWFAGLYSSVGHGGAEYSADHIQSSAVLSNFIITLFQWSSHTKSPHGHQLGKKLQILPSIGTGNITENHVDPIQKRSRSKFIGTLAILATGLIHKSFKYCRIRYGLLHKTYWRLSLSHNIADPSRRWSRSTDDNHQAHHPIPTEITGCSGDIGCRKMDPTQNFYLPCLQEKLVNYF